jgi:hypothetical protein
MILPAAKKMLPTSEKPAPLTESREAAVRAELAGLLVGAAFRTSKRSRDFLEYVVERTLKGLTETLKERSIGVELFQLPADFDAGQHTIVRVTANEVRKKLAQHYMTGNGAPHPVRIDLPPGSYRAEFRWESPQTPPAELKSPALPPPPVLPETPPPAPASRPVTRRSWQAMLALSGGSLAVASALTLWRSRSADLPSASVLPLASGTGLAPTAALPGSDTLRMIVGTTSPYLDRSGRAWGSDRFFTGGTILFRQSERILRTLDPDIYRRVRVGEFRYDIPLAAGTYELHLHFAETLLSDFISADSGGEGQRVFNILANGEPLLKSFDVVADAAGQNISDERIFRDITPGPDGFLHLNFTAMRGSPMVSAIELLPVSPGTVRPIRIRTGWTTSWQDSAGNQWQSDSYFLGGNALVRTTNPARDSSTTAHDAALFGSERWGHFSYAIPVADGRYRLTLKFCEGHYGNRNSGRGGAGSRLFDVYCNGVALLRNFDIFKEAGGEGRPLDRRFAGVRPTAQGKIVLTFVPIAGMACVNGIEVIAE